MIIVDCAIICIKVPRLISKNIVQFQVIWKWVSYGTGTFDKLYPTIFFRSPVYTRELLYKKKMGGGGPRGCWVRLFKMAIICLNLLWALGKYRYSVKKENQIVLIYKEIQSGAVAKS
jgi:hypothetical protein